MDNVYSIKSKKKVVPNEPEQLTCGCCNTHFNSIYDYARHIINSTMLLVDKYDMNINYHTKELDRPLRPINLNEIVDFIRGDVPLDAITDCPVAFIRWLLFNQIEETYFGILDELDK